MPVMVAQGLRNIRESAGITREALVKKTRDLSLGTIRNAEKGRRVTNDTATQIRDALNILLKEKGFPEVNLDDLQLTPF